MTVGYFPLHLEQHWEALLYLPLQPSEQKSLDQILETAEVQAFAVVVAVVVAEAVVVAVVLVLVVHLEPVLVEHQDGKLDKFADAETRIGGKTYGRCDCRATSWLWVPASPPDR